MHSPPPPPPLSWPCGFSVVAPQPAASTLAAHSAVRTDSRVRRDTSSLPRAYCGLSSANPAIWDTRSDSLRVLRTGQYAPIRASGHLRLVTESRLRRRSGTVHACRSHGVRSATKRSQWVTGCMWGDIWTGSFTATTSARNWAASSARATRKAPSPPAPSPTTRTPSAPWSRTGSSSSTITRVAQHRDEHGPGQWTRCRLRERGTGERRERVGQGLPHLPAAEHRLLQRAGPAFQNSLDDYLGVEHRNVAEINKSGPQAGI